MARPRLFHPGPRRHRGEGRRLRVLPPHHQNRLHEFLLSPRPDEQGAGQEVEEVEIWPDVQDVVWAGEEVEEVEIGGVGKNWEGGSFQVDHAATS